MRPMRMIVRKTLQDIGLRNIIEAENGALAWNEITKSIAENAPFELVVSDWNMPTMTGIELLKSVRADSVMKIVPFVLLTAEAEKSQIVDALQAGVSNYIIKPFTPATFREKLEQTFIKHGGKISA